MELSPAFALFHTMPAELLYYTLTFLTPAELVVLQRSCSYLFHFVKRHGQGLWRELAVAAWDIDRDSSQQYTHVIDWKLYYESQHRIFGGTQNHLYPRGVEVPIRDTSLPDLPPRHREGISPVLRETDGPLRHITNEVELFSWILEPGIAEGDSAGDVHRPSPRFGHTCSVFGTDIYFIGGQDADEQRLGEVWRFDTVLRKFSLIQVSAPDTVPNFARHVAGLYDGKLFCFGGFDFTKFWGLSIYDFALNTWTYPSETSGIQPPLRSNHAWARSGDTFVMFGGSLGSSDDNYKNVRSSYALNARTLTWSKLHSKNMPSKRVGHVMLTVGSTVYLFGGGVWSHEHSWEHQYNSLYAYDRTTDSWREIGTHNRPPLCTYTYAFVLGPYLCFFGGACIHTNNVTKKLYMFDTVSERWSAEILCGGADGLSGRSMGTAAVVGNEIFFFGGFSGGVLRRQDFVVLRVNCPVIPWQSVIKE